MTIEWDVTPDKMLDDLATDYATAIKRGIYLICQRYAAEIEAWMKAGTNAPWKDRTANARQGLYAKVEEELNEYIQILIDHTMDYGVRLEFDYGGRFAVIAPALDMFAPKIWADIEALLK